MLMKPPSRLLLAVVGLLMVGFSLAGLYQIGQYRHHAAQLREAEALKREFQRIAREPDNGRAIQSYAALADRNPDVHLRILQRQWAMAVSKMARLRNARAVSALENDIPILLGDLSAHLADMAERSRAALAGREPVRGEIAWRIHNIRASLEVMRAFLAESVEGNPKKALSHLTTAVGSLKSAIRIIDGVRNPGFLKNIPRWNMALIVGQNQTLRLSPGATADDRRLDLRDNLEAVIPETGGYAPGAPPETGVAK